MESKAVEEVRMHDNRGSRGKFVQATLVTTRVEIP